MLPPEVAEARLLSAIQTPQDIGKLVRAGLVSESFSVYGEVFTFFREYAREYGSIPDWSDLVAQLGELAPEHQPSTDLDYYLEEVLGHYTVARVHAAIVDRLGQGGEKLLSDPDLTTKLLAEDLRKLQRVDSQHLAWLDRDAIDRLAWLQESASAAKSGAVLGIPTGLKCFDAAMQGWEAGEAVMVMAPKGAGKSWLAMHFGAVAHSYDRSVLFLSPEMSLRQCAYRFDVTRAYQAGKQLSHEALRTGKADEVVYREWLEILSTKEKFLCIDSSESGGFTTANILGFIDEYRPDLVILDGIHLVGGLERQSGWERIKEAADALKATAQRLACSVIWTSQVDRAAMNNPTEPAATGGSAAYGKAAVEAANRLITLARHKTDDRQRLFKVPNNRSGQEFHQTQRLIFDVDIGRIEHVPNSAKPEGVGENAAKDESEATF